MFDSLRDQASGDPTLNAESTIDGDPGPELSPAYPPTGGRFRGMTAPQRLIIAVLLMLAVCILGTMCLLVTGRIGFI
jgi:hypothetical protein